MEAGISWVDTESDESGESDEEEVAYLEKFQGKMSPQKQSPARQEGDGEIGELSDSSLDSNALASEMEQGLKPYVGHFRIPPLSNLRNKIPERGSSLGHTDCDPRSHLNDASPRPRPKIRITDPYRPKPQPAAGMEAMPKEGRERNPSLKIIPASKIEAWLENVVDALVHLSPPRIEGPFSRKPLPKSVLDSLKAAVATFPDAILNCDNVSVEMIRSQWGKVKVPVSKKHELGRVFGGNSVKHGSSLKDAECWAVIKNVFQSGSDGHCEALYAYIMAYNYITMLTGNRRPNASPVQTAEKKPQDPSLHSREHEHENQPQRIVETPTTISHKAANFLGISSPPRQGPSAFQDPVPFPPPPPIPDSPPPPPQLPYSASRVERLLLRPRKSFHDLFRKKNDIYEGIGDNASTSTNRLQKQPPRGTDSTQSNLNQPQTFFGSRVNLSQHQLPSAFSSSQHLPGVHTNSYRPPFSKPLTPVPTTAARKWKKSKESNRDPSTWIPLSQSEAIDTRARSDEALRELHALRIGLARAIAQTFVTLRQDNFSVEAAGSGMQNGHDRDDHHQSAHHRHNGYYNHRDQRRHEGRGYSDLFGDNQPSNIFDPDRGNSYDASPGGLRNPSGGASSSHFSSLSSRDRVRAGSGKGKETVHPTEAVKESPPPDRRRSPPPANGHLPLRVQAESDAAFIRTLCELVRTNEEALMRREEGNGDLASLIYQPYVRIGTPANK
ncbi:hypothetical protein SLS62_003439 [Diatrype stigma]|uniref:Uncharacterized protein n=1 Tax=Diatrype stigma TaxID=117547 RepID=A0AAN9YUQ6_9PEZI